MSVLPNQTNATPGDAFFWTVTASTITAKTFSSDRVLTDTLSTGSITVGAISTTGSIVVSGDITAQNLTATDTLTSYFANFQYAATVDGANIGGLLIASNIAGYDTIFYPQAVMSTISTSHIILDGNQLDTGGAGLGAVLLLNGIPIATTSTSISSLTEWSFYPALTDVFWENHNLTEVNLLQATDIQTSVINASNVDIAQDLTVGGTLTGNIGDFIQINTETITPENIIGQALSISSIVANSITANNLTITSNIITDNLTAFCNVNSFRADITELTSQNAAIVNGSIISINATNATISGTTTVNEVRGVNGFINAEAANRMRFRVLGSVDPFSSPDIIIEAGGGNRGIVNITANPGVNGIQGECTVKAKGGTAAGYATGGLLNLLAERGSAVLGTANTSRVNIAADSITSYAGGPTPFAGLLGYNFLYGLLGVNIVAATPPTLPNVPGTVYLYGLNPLGLGSSGGVRIQNGMSIDFITPYPQGFIAPEYDLFIRGNPAGQKVTLCNVRYIFGDNALLTGFQDVNTTNLSATNLNGTNIFGTNFLASNVNVSSGTISSLTTQNGFVQGLNLSSLNGYTVQQLLNPDLLSSFQQFFTSTLQANTISTNTANINQITGVSTLNGYTVEQLISSVSPLVFFSTVSSFQELFTSSLQANTISTNTANINQITGVSTLNGYTVEQLISSVSPLVFFSTVSTFQELFTSSLQAQNVSTINLQALDITGLSTINGFSVADFVSSIGPPPLIVSTFTQLFTSSLVASNVSTQVLNAASVQLNGIPLTPQTSTFGFLSTDLFQANQISSGLLVASSINGYTIQQLLNPQVLSSFDTLFASTATIFELFVSTGTIFNASNLVLNVSSINGFNTSQFLSTSGTQSQISTFSTLTTDQFQANQISSGLFVASSINGFTIQQLINPVVSTISTFQQLFTSSIQTNNLSTNTGNVLSLTGVSTINGFTIADFVSSVSPQPPIPSTVFQFFTSSLAANSVTNYQTSNLSLIAPTVIVSTNSLVENVGNYNLTVTSNIDINSSNYVRIYNTNTAPSVGTDDIYILAQGNTNIGSQQTTSITAANNILVNAGQSATFQGNFVVINSPQEIQLVGTQQLRGSASNIAILVPSAQSAIYLSQSNGIDMNTNQSLLQSATNSIGISSATVNLSGAVNINGVPYGSVVSSFTTLATDVLTNNTTGLLSIKSGFQTTLSTGNTILVESGEILAYARSVIDFFAQNAVALSTQTIYLDAPITNVLATLNAPLINATSIVGNTASNSLYFGSTIHTNTLRNNDSINGDLNIIAAYPSISSIATLIAGQNVALIASDQGNITALELYISTGDTYIDGNVSLTDTLDVNSIINLTTINGQPYVPGGSNITISTFQQLFTSSIVLNTINGAAYPPPASQTVSTFQQLFTSSIVVNTINGAAYPPPDSNTISTFQQLFTSSILGVQGTFSNINFVGNTAELFAEDSLQIFAPTQVSLQSGSAASIITLSNNILIQPGFVDPGQLVIRGTTNFSNNALINVSSINGQIPGGGGGGPSISTFQQLFTSSIVGTDATFSNVTLVGATAELFATEGSLQINASNILTLGGTAGAVLVSLSNNIFIEPGFVTPAQLVITADTNLSNHNLLNVGNINGFPYIPSQSASSFSTLFTSSILMNTGTFCNILALGLDPNILSEDDLTIQASNTLAVSAFNGVGIISLSNDITLAAGFAGPGEVRITASPLNMCNFNINNVDVLNAGNIVATNLINTNGFISSLTVSTINTYPHHKAFGCGWATTDSAELQLLANTPNFINFPTRNQFNLEGILTNQFETDENNFPLNKGIYQINARCTFSNNDVTTATISSWIQCVPDTSDSARQISRCIIQVEPGKIGTTFMTCQSLITQSFGVTAYTTSPNCTLYYDPGDGLDIPPSYAMNITAHQLYQFDNPPFVYNWPPNPLA